MPDIKSWIDNNMSPWDLFGLVGQCMFMARFFFQWIHTERAKRVVVPNIFWYLSVAGGAVLLVYAIHLRKVVFILAQSALPIYMRNIYLIWHHKKPKDLANG